MADWPSVTLQALAESGNCEIKTGPFGTVLKASEYASEGVPLISTGEIVGGQFRVGAKTPRVGPKTISRLPQFLLRQGDVVFARKGGVERNAYVSRQQEGWFLGSDALRVRVSGPLTGRFLSYHVCSTTVRAWLTQQAGGSTMASLNQAILGRLEVPLPPLEEQERIAGVLGAFDDLIETNISIVRYLGDLGKTVVAASTIRQSTLETVPLSLACSVIESGRRPKGGVKGIDSGVPSIGAESVNGLTEFNFSKTKYVPEEFADGMKRGVLADLDVLVYKDGGKPGEFFPDVSIVGRGYPFDRMVINEHVFRVRAAGPLGQGYLYFWLSTDEMMRQMKEIGSRTAAIPGMNSTNFGKLPIPIPPADWRVTYVPALDHLVEGALSLLAECRDLARQRDELLPLLMSGRVRVRDVEAAVS